MGSKVRVLPEALIEALSYGRVACSDEVEMDQREVIAGSFDLKKLTKACNFTQCAKPASVEALVFEEDTVSGRRRELVSLYLCREHYRTALGKLLEELNRERKQGKVNGVEVFDIGYITW